MPYPAVNCTAVNIMPSSPKHIRSQFDHLMNAARDVCADFVGHVRKDGALIVVPICRANATNNKNLLTVKWTTRSLRLDIRPRQKGVTELQMYSQSDLLAYRQHMAARFAELQLL
jgi:hypothetical protein